LSLKLVYDDDDRCWCWRCWLILQFVGRPPVLPRIYHQ